MNKSDFELLAPAGNFEKMKAAIRFGADAVYLAGKQFGMRSAADNFTVEEIYKAVEYAHAHGKKVYLTLNTIPRTDEYPALYAFLEDIRNAGLDAAICTDLGVIATVRERIPGLEIHISTQASIMSPAAARAYADLGIKRLVLARELTFPDAPERIGADCFGGTPLPEEDAAMIKQAQRNAIMRDPTMAAATIVGAQSDAMRAAAANEGGDRETTITFKTTDGKKEYTAQQALSQKGAIVECSVADFLAAEVGNTQYRITGVISSVANATYGNVYLRDWSGEAYVYGIGAKGDFEKLGLKVGDIVTLVGKRGEYKGTAQMTGAQYEKHIAVTQVSLADFLAKPDSKTDYYMVTGTVKDLLDNKGRTNDYGNLHLTDGTNELYVYGCYAGYGATGDNRKGFIASAGIKEGDELTMIGYKDTYNGLIELCGGIYFSHKSANAE